MTASKSTKVLPPLHKISAVVKEVEATIQLFSSLWNIAPWQVVEKNLSQLDMVLSAPGRVKMARARLGSIVLELLQPIEGDTIWSEIKR